MQIPRGTFRSLSKGSDLQTLIRDLMRSSFTGYCKINQGGSLIVLVFENGTLLLAGNDALKGDEAWEKIQDMRGTAVDAVLHDLDPAQIKLALEFNPSARIVHPKKGDPLGTHESGPGEVHLTGSSGASGRRVVYDRDPFSIPKRNDPEQIPVHVWRKGGTSEMNPRHAMPSNQDSGCDDPLQKDLDALDTLDIAAMASKFRENCRQMIHKLDLDHLIDEKSGKDAR